MQIFRFLEEETSRFALTRDQAGARLPVTGAVWLFAGSADLADGPLAVGLESAAIKAGILRKGYFLWPDDLVGDPAREIPQARDLFD